jgi:hypothetical protein
MFIVSDNFMKIMDFEAEFSRQAEAAGIRNPFKVQIAQFARKRLCRPNKESALAMKGAFLSVQARLPTDVNHADEPPRLRMRPRASRSYPLRPA